MLQIHADTVPLHPSADNIIYVGKTRVPLETVIKVFNSGISPEEIVFQFPALALPDVYLVIGYYLQHRDEVDTYVQQAEIHSEQVRRENETRFDTVGMRERLLNRIKSQE
jgi:uncharacterized protein (DUF433 family)